MVGAKGQLRLILPETASAGALLPSVSEWEQHRVQAFAFRLCLLLVWMILLDTLAVAAAAVAWTCQDSLPQVDCPIILPSAQAEMQDQLRLVWPLHRLLTHAA